MKTGAERIILKNEPLTLKSDINSNTKVELPQANNIKSCINMKEPNNHKNDMFKFATKSKTKLLHGITSHQLKNYSISFMNKYDLTNTCDDTNPTDTTEIIENTSRRIKGHIDIFKDNRTNQKSFDNKKCSINLPRTFTKVDLFKNLNLKQTQNKKVSMSTQLHNKNLTKQ